MVKIKKYGDFTSEAISGTEVPTMRNGSYFGPSYGDTESPNTISAEDTTLRYSKLLDRPISEDEFNDLYDEYLSKSDKSIKKEFTTNCIDEILAEIG